MNREILFKGKRVDNGKWVYGYYVLDGLGCQIISKKDGSCFNVMYETVSQYTGLKDKTGKKIFEGDVISFKVAYSCDDEYKIPRMVYRHSIKTVSMPVTYSHGCFILHDDRIPDDRQMLWCWDELEITGNIHD